MSCENPAWSAARRDSDGAFCPAEELCPCLNMITDLGVDYAEDDFQAAAAVCLTSEVELRSNAKHVGHVRVIGNHKMKKHFDLTITENSFSYACRRDSIAAEAAIYCSQIMKTHAAAELFARE